MNKKLLVLFPLVALSLAGCGNQTTSSSDASNPGSDTASEITSSENTEETPTSVTPVTINYGTQDSPLTVSQVLTELEKIADTPNKGYTANYFFIKANLKDAPSGSTTSIRLVLTDGTKEINVSSATLGDNISFEDLYQNDEVLVRGYARHGSGTSEDWYISYNNTLEDSTNSAPKILLRTAGKSSVIISGEHVAISGLEDKMTNGTTATFTVKADDGYRVDSVKINDVLVAGEEDTYSFVIKGNTNIDIETSQIVENAHVVSVSITGEDSVELNETLALTATVEADEGADRSVVWSIEDGEDYIELSQTGVVTPIAVGRATIKVTTNGLKEDGTAATATITITVKNTYGTLTNPISVEQALALIPNENGAWTEKQMYIEGKIKSLGTYYSDYDEQDIVLTDGTNELEANKVIFNDEITHENIYVGDTVIVHGWGEYFNKKQVCGYKEHAYPTFESRTAGEATLNISYDSEKVVVTGLPETYKNGDKVEFTVAVADSYIEQYAISTVKLDSTILEANGGVYSFIIYGEMNLAVEIASLEAHATRVVISGDTSVKVGSSITLSALVAGDEGVSQVVTWSIDDEDKAEIDQAGVLTGKEAGTVTVSATAEAKNSSDEEVIGTYEVDIEKFAIADISETDVEIDGLVAKIIGINAKNVFIDDGTSGVVVNCTNNQSSELAIGDVVSVKGTTSTYNKGLQIKNGVLTKLDEEEVEVSTNVTPLTETLATELIQGTKPGTKFSMRTDIVAGSATYPTWNSCGIPVERANYSPVAMTAGNIYDIEGYVQGTFTGSGVTYLMVVVTSAVEVEGKITLTSSADSVEINSSITLSATSTDETFTWSVTSKTEGAEATLSATSGSEVTLTGVSVGTVTITVTNETGYSVTKDIVVAEEGEIVPVSVSKNMTDVASENSWKTSQGNTAYCYTSFNLDENITVSTTGNANCGSFWGSDWRLYQNQNGNIKVTAADGYAITAVTITYTVSNSGCLHTSSETNVTSAAYSSGTEIILDNLSEFEAFVANTNGKTNGQVRVTAVSVTYVAIA